MSDINAAPSNTEPATTELLPPGDNHEWTQEELAAIQAGGVPPMQINQIAEAGTSASGESIGMTASSPPSPPIDATTLGATALADANTAVSISISTVASAAADALAVAASGEHAAGGASDATATSASNAAGSEAAGTAAADIPAACPSTAHSWLALLERKLAVLEHEARDELLDVARQLREAL
ncbi:hypothetical protein [Burkholderia territorii]|uniref:hypothetical protein n=1 Tax=Burkholderia territorii TaxID=1503055 RepID=UPI00075ECFA9|nr:hypothetical protein [Burkholderia territorii]KUZ35264.1 hypothetical protein WS52_04700 [Burkholderia territorii]KUZ46431.1 hypothetical protein WS53_27370 [Burkholderia territorii]